MKKYIFISMLLSSSLLFGTNNNSSPKKVDTILAHHQDIKNRLELLKKKELYIQELEKKLTKENYNNDLDKKYEQLEKNF